LFTIREGEVYEDDIISSMPDIFDSSKSVPKRIPQVELQETFVQDENTNAETQEEPLVAAEDSGSSTTMPNPTHPAENVQPPREVDEYSSIMRQEKPTTNLFNAFAPKPVNTSFDNQQEQETVLLLLRQHPVTQIKWVLVAILLILVPFLFSYVGFLNFLPARFHIVAAIGWYLMVVGFILEAFLSWFYNVYIITDERIVDVDFNSLLFKNISYAKIENIEDVTTTAGGTLGTIFDYGTITIQTAATIPEFEFQDVPHPSRVAAFINEMMLEEEREVREGRAI
jgi:hypothetical protein